MPVFTSVIRRLGYMYTKCRKLNSFQAWYVTTMGCIALTARDVSKFWFSVFTVVYYFCLFSSWVVCGRCRRRIVGTYCLRFPPWRWRHHLGLLRYIAVGDVASIFRVESGGRMYLQNVGNIAHNHTAQGPKNRININSHSPFENF